MIEQFWKTFLSQTNRDPNTKMYCCDHFEYNEKACNALLALVISGQKKATSSSYIAYQIENEPLPKKGDLSVITDWDNIPKCVVETTDVIVLPFKDITYELCSQEGEDEDLLSWQKNHIKFFEYEANELGYTFTTDMLVVFERFKVVFVEKENE